MSVSTYASELRGGDSIRFPDGKGGHYWVPIARAVATEHNVELLIALPDTDPGYKTLPAAMQVIRSDRAGETT